jgi:hypothetical protein
MSEDILPHVKDVEELLRFIVELAAEVGKPVPDWIRARAEALE